MRPRETLACFFDSASIAELLLEGSAIVAVPAHLRDGLMDSFPHGFRGLPKAREAELVDVLSHLASGCTAIKERVYSAEIRHELVVEPSGRRLARKSLVLNDEVCHTEERVL